jgi:hypothetical protein
MECNKKVYVLITNQRTAVIEIVAQLGNGPQCCDTDDKDFRIQQSLSLDSQPMTDEHRRACMDVLLQLLQWYAAKGNDFLLNIMTSNKS